MTRALNTVLAVLIGALALVGCVPAGQSGQAPDAPLRVGLAANYPPIVFRESGELRGVEIDLARELGAALGRPLELVELEWEALIPSLERGRVDILMAGMSVTEERARRVSFAESYLQIGQMALIRLADMERLGAPGVVLDVSGPVGFVENTTGAAFVAQRMRRAVPVGVRDTDAGIALLKRGEIDAFVHDAPTVWRIGAAPEHQDLMGLFWPMTNEYLAWAVRKDDAELLAAVNARIAEWRANGTLRAVLQRWIPVRVELK